MPAPTTSILISAGRFFFRARNIFFPVAILVLLLLSPPRLSFASAGLDRGVDALGVFVALVGQAIRVLVIGLAYIQRGGRGGKVHADELVVDGVFAFSRNPLYVGNILVLAGIFLVANSPALTFVGIPLFAFIYASIVAAEEEFLGAKFGAAYADYCRRVPRFLPRDPAFLGVARSMQFDWRRVLRKEYGSTFTWMTIMLGLFLWEAYIARGTSGMRAALPKIGALWTLVIVSYGVVRALKKTGRLRTPAVPAAG